MTKFKATAKQGNKKLAEHTFDAADKEAAEAYVLDALLPMANLPENTKVTVTKTTAGQKKPGK
jgi:hypothetical protein